VDAGVFSGASRERRGDFSGELYGTVEMMILLLLTSIYGIGFVGVFCLHTQLPATLGLALLRSAFWPLWVTTGWPHGQPLPMD
jgi:hypothetical protein